MKNVQSFNDFVNEAYGGPYDDDMKCIITGVVDYDVMVDVNKAYRGAISASEFESFIADVEDLLKKNVARAKKLGVSSCEIYTPLNVRDANYEMWTKDENGDYIASDLAFKVVCEVDKYYATLADDVDYEEGVARDLAVDLRKVAAIAKRYKFADEKSVYIELGDTELSADCA